MTIFQKNQSWYCEALNTPAWSALNSIHADLCTTQGNVRAYPREMAQFAAIDPMVCADKGDLETFVSARGHEVTFMQASPVRVPAGIVCTRWPQGVQMVLQDAMRNPPKVALAALMPLDVPEMTRLVALTEPGPFEAQTIWFGSYWGVRRDR